MGLPWQSSGWDWGFALQEDPVSDLVRELRSCKPHSAAEKTNNDNKKEREKEKRGWKIELG